MFTRNYRNHIRSLITNKLIDVGNYIIVLIIHELDDVT